MAAFNSVGATQYSVERSCIDATMETFISSPSVSLYRRYNAALQVRVIRAELRDAQVRVIIFHMAFTTISPCMGEYESVYIFTVTHGQRCYCRQRLVMSKYVRTADGVTIE